MAGREMDKSDLDFLINSQDVDLLYKHILKEVRKLHRCFRVGYNRYVIGQVRIHMLDEYAVYNEYDYTLNIGRVDKYAMEL
jgi:KaiC/GvpD/RAD55 family RecA-like ATPase